MWIPQFIGIAVHSFSIVMTPYFLFQLHRRRWFWNLCSIRECSWSCKGHPGEIRRQGAVDWLGRPWQSPPGGRPLPVRQRHGATHHTSRSRPLMGNWQEEESGRWLPGCRCDPEAASGRPKDQAGRHDHTRAACTESQRAREQHWGEHRWGDQWRVQPVPEEKHRYGLRKIRNAQGWDRIQGGCSWEVLRRCGHQDAVRAHQVLQALVDCRLYKGTLVQLQFSIAFLLLRLVLDRLFKPATVTSVRSYSWRSKPA